jgi:hypothetical protein
MIIYIDKKNKKCFISAPKCGNHTISNYLKVPLHVKYSIEEINNCLTDNNYQKIIIVRNVYDRFISGFYEDLKNNKCYNNINISFYEYCKFLKYIFDNKIQNVTNLNVYFSNIDANINWGNCSNKSLPITNSTGSISGHLRSLKESINKWEKKIQGDNVKVIYIEELSKYLGFYEKFNCKSSSSENNYDYNTPLSTLHETIIKSNVYPLKNNMFNEEIKQIIMHIYKSDIDYIYYLNSKYNNDI